MPLILHLDLLLHPDHASLVLLRKQVHGRPLNLHARVALFLPAPANLVLFPKPYTIRPLILLALCALFLLMGK